MSQLAKSYNFDSAQGWTYTPETGDGSGGWQEIGGNTGGCVYTQVFGRNKVDNGIIELSTTWEALGIPSGSIVETIDSSSFDWRISVANVIDSPTVGILGIFDSSNVLQATLISSVGGGTSTTSFANRSNSSPVSIPSAIQASDSAIKIRLLLGLDNANNASAQTTILIDNIDFTIGYSVSAIDLVIQYAGHSLSSDNVELTQTHSLSVNDTLHELISDSIELEQVHILSVNDTEHELTSDNIELAVSITLSVNDCSHSQTSENIVLLQIHEIVVQNTVHSQSVENVLLSQTHNLVVSDSHHSLSSESPVLDIAANLLVNDAVHALSSDNVVLEVEEVIQLIIQNSHHSLSSDNVNLIQIHELTVNDSLHELSSDNVNLSNSIELTVNNSVHELSSDNIELSQTHNLLVNDSNHLLTSLNIILFQFHVLFVYNCIHLHSSDNVILDYGSEISNIRSINFTGYFQKGNKKTEHLNRRVVKERKINKGVNVLINKQNGKSS